MLTSKRYGEGLAAADWPPYCRRLWQRNYFEHIIRDEASLNNLRRYIADNPSRAGNSADDDLFARALDNFGEPTP